MTAARPVAALTPPDAQVLDLLLHVVEIGKHRGTFTAADVVRVAEAHLPNPRTLRRALINERARADQAAQEIAELRALLGFPNALRPARRTA